jgi:separase
VYLSCSVLGLTVLLKHYLLQELLAYGLMEARNKTFCAKMQMRIIDILFNELYCSKEYNLERSRVLVRKAGALRASGVKHIHSCLKYLSEAISLLVRPTTVFAFSCLSLD